jgi:transcriptional regulator with XRE-family HTH domain
VSYVITGRNLRSEREAAEVSQEALARKLGISAKTVQRMEAAESVKARAATTYRLALEELARDGTGTKSPDNVVPRGTPEQTDLGKEGGLSRQLRILAAEFEVEALKLGAEEEEMAYVRQALQSPETARMFAYGYVDRAGLSEDALRLDYEGLIEGLRLYVKMRVKRRNEAKRRT